MDALKRTLKVLVILAILVLVTIIVEIKVC